MAIDPQFLMIEGAPTPVAPFSHAVRVGPWLFVTGQMPTDPNNDAAPLPDGIEAQTAQVIENLRRVSAPATSRPMWSRCGCICWNSSAITLR